MKQIKRKKFCILVNPAAGRGKTKKVFTKIQPLFESSFVQSVNYFSDHPGFITDFIINRNLSDFDGLVKINVNSNKIVFFVGESILISKLIDGNFPEYKRVIPKENKNTLKVDRLSFSLAVDRVSTITTDKLPVIKLKIMDNMVNLTSVNNENGTATEDINVNFSGDEMEIGFNSKYILEMINNLEDEIITLDFKDSASPVIATEESNPNLIYVLMPMRV